MFRQYNPGRRGALSMRPHFLSSFARLWLAAAAATLGLACAAPAATAAPASQAPTQDGTRAQPPASAGPASPRSSRFDQARLARIDSVVERAIAAREAPGAVVIVGDTRGNAFERVYGRRAVEPSVEAHDGRHHLRCRLAHEGRCHDVRRDAADRGRTPPPDRSRGRLHPGLREVRQGAHHHPPPDDSHVWASPRCRPHLRVARHRRGHSTRVRGGAARPTRRSHHLQRHQLLPAWRDRPARERRTPRSASCAPACSSRSG